MGWEGEIQVDRGDPGAAGGVVGRDALGHERPAFGQAGLSFQRRAQLQGTQSLGQIDEQRPRPQGEPVPLDHLPGAIGGKRRREHAGRHRSRRHGTVLREPGAQGQDRQGRDHEHGRGGCLGEGEAIFPLHHRSMAQHQRLTHPVPLVGAGAVSAQGRDAMLQLREHAFRFIAFPVPGGGGVEPQQGAAGAHDGAQRQDQGQSGAQVPVHDEDIGAGKPDHPAEFHRHEKARAQHAALAGEPPARQGGHHGDLVV